MTTDTSRAMPHASIFAEATEWLVDFRAGDVDDEARRRFSAWLRRSPEHIQAYMEAAALWGDIPKLAADMEVDVDSVVARASAQSTVTILPTGGPGARSEPMSASGRRDAPIVRRPWTVAAAAAAVVIAAAFVTWWQLDRGSIYATAIGERRSIALADGSTMELGARSRVRVGFSHEERDVELLGGQALFSIAKDPSRPFVVRTDDTRVRAVGTQFDVHRRSSGTTVTVLEGRVAVLAESKSSVPFTASSATTPQDRALYVSAGEQVIVAAAPTHTAAGAALARNPELRAIDVDRADHPAWVGRTLIFENAPLSDVVEEFNRYNEKQMSLPDISIGALRISGVFSANKPASLLRFMSEQMDLDVTMTDRNIEISARSSGDTSQR
jgi:transmembrane sensor